MNIAYVANARIPSEKAHPYQILKMCEALKNNGVDVELIMPFRFQTSRKLKQIQNIWKYYGIKNKFKMVKLPSFDLIWLDAYIGSFPWHLRFTFQAFSFAFFATIYSLFRKVDVYYTRDCYFALFFRYVKFPRKKIYYESHTFEPIVSRLMKKGKVDGLIAITNELKKAYVRQGIPEKKILVAPDGVDLRLFPGNLQKESARKELGIPRNKTVVCYTGHLYRWKGTHILAQAMRKLADDYLLYVVGGTLKDISEFEEFISANRIPNVITVGYVPPKMIPKYLAAADVLVLPNTSEEAISRLYTSPLKLFEYMAARRPIVASDLPSVREILDEKSAMLVKSDDPEALAEGIRKVLEYGESGHKLAENAFQEVRLYTWEKRAEKILEFMFSLVQ